MRPPAAVKPKSNRPLDRIGYAMATGFGAGHAPVAPGTFGAAEGVVLFFIINAVVNQRLALPAAVSLSVFVIINVALYALGVWAANRAIAATGLKDPSVAVIDEVSGQLIAMTPLIVYPSLLGYPSLAGVAVSFVLFRAFDIFKPYPIRRLERLRGGLGVMSDDALAGIYAAVLTWLAHYLKWI
ncbi:MAG: phosphatidylglycerophosphatase A [Blastocatellia bacterium]